MGPSKIMIIRHSEKPGNYSGASYSGINALGQPDPASLITMGWERAGGIASLFYPAGEKFHNPYKDLDIPDHIYASDPTLAGKYKMLENGNYIPGGISQRPYQTISALYGKMGVSVKKLNTAFSSEDYSKMVKNVLTREGIVLIAWQHQYILPRVKGDKSIVGEFFDKTGTSGKNCPTTAWPGDRYDMVLVLEMNTKTGQISEIKQVPQMLLFGDLTTPIF